MMLDRARGCAVGAAVGDALGMPLEFGPRQPADRLVREMQAGRLPAGTFTDDTEMALALAESMLVVSRRDPAHGSADHSTFSPAQALGDEVAQRFVSWYRTGPDDIGNHTRAVLSRIAAGETWQDAVEAAQRRRPESAGNGSVMRCWPVALAHWDDLDRLLADSRLQSQVTHPHPECVAGCAFVNAAVYRLLHGIEPAQAVGWALEVAAVPQPLRLVIESAPSRRREELQNSGWVRDTLESAVWGLLTTDSFEEAVVQVVSLGNDADTAGAVVGAMAGAAYGCESIPAAWHEALRGEWPPGSGRIWRAQDLAGISDRLVEIPTGPEPNSGAPSNA